MGLGDLANATADIIGDVLANLLVVVRALADATTEAIGRAELAPDELYLGARSLRPLGIVQALGIVQLRPEISQALLVRLARLRVEPIAPAANGADAEVLRLESCWPRVRGLARRRWRIGERREIEDVELAVGLAHEGREVVEPLGVLEPAHARLVHDGPVCLTSRVSTARNAASICSTLRRLWNSTWRPEILPSASSKCTR
jgi:hypothetical protein